MRPIKKQVTESLGKGAPYGIIQQTHPIFLKEESDSTQTINRLKELQECKNRFGNIDIDHQGNFNIRGPVPEIH